MRRARLARWRELDDDLPIPVELGAAQGAPGKACEAEPLAREQGRPDVVELVPGRELELLGRELGRLRALVGGSKRRLGVQGGEPGRLPPELLDRLFPRDVLEEP